ncbi:hypothetical protein ACFPYI_06875 [Halomarina salina]|uniref:Uncharacterized protein n=1 Tax=Halomarina salina TaxID=1872699 RepID=A0ABD5RL91_9EURY|nr:hypothetical protein [Halomarina salina]
MSALKLIPYTVQLHPTGKPDEMRDLSALDEEDTEVQSELTAPDIPQATGVGTFTDLFRQFCEHYESVLKDLGEDKNAEQLANVTLALSSQWKHDKNVVEGYLYLGKYGVRRALTNVPTGQRDEDGREFEDTMEKPLYFLMYTPPGETNKAYLLLERSRRYGAKGPFDITLREYVNEAYDDGANVKVRPIKTDDIFPKLRDADLATRLRLERDGSASQLHSRFDDVFGEDSMQQAIEFRPDGEDLEVVVDELESWYNESPNAFSTIDGVAYDNVKITVENNGSEETISLTKGETQLLKNIELSDQEGDIADLKEISFKAHSFLRTVAGSGVQTDSLFD